jgi:hypothetical protein
MDLLMWTQWSRKGPPDRWRSEGASSTPAWRWWFFSHARRGYCFKLSIFRFSLLVTHVLVGSVSSTLKDARPGPSHRHGRHTVTSKWNYSGSYLTIIPICFHRKMAIIAHNVYLMRIILLLCIILHYYFSYYSTINYHISRCCYA